MSRSAPAQRRLHDNQERRGAALAQLETELRTAGGQLVQSLLVAQIGYHGVLGTAPARLPDLLQIGADLIVDRRVTNQGAEGRRGRRRPGVLLADRLGQAARRGDRGR
jgi:hypothetical protein